jgi:hypothetical protein
MSCPADCGRCEECGNGYCETVVGEDCLTCAPDCGVCERCGDLYCDEVTESCYTCPADCGTCAGCGDGSCGSGEDCASCSRDCGVCSVCGNSRCEPPYETCVNCPGDCGTCEVITCDEVLFCTLGCIDFEAYPPQFSVSCIANCSARACDDVQYLVDEFIDCAVWVVIDGGDIDSVLTECDEQVAACMGARC